MKTQFQGDNYRRPNQMVGRYTESKWIIAQPKEGGGVQILVSCSRCYEGEVISTLTRWITGSRSYDNAFVGKGDFYGDGSFAGTYRILEDATTQAFKQAGVAL